MNDNSLLLYCDVSIGVFDSNTTFLPVTVKPGDALPYILLEGYDPVLVPAPTVLDMLKFVDVTVLPLISNDSDIISLYTFKLYVVLATEVQLAVIEESVELVLIFVGTPVPVV